MRCPLLICLAVTIGTSVTSDRVVIHTSNQTGPLYQFFPLRTNSLYFSVKATNDIHICLTNGAKIEPPYYEIVIGGYSNTKSIIRKDSPDIQVEHVGKVINQEKFQTYWVTIDDAEGSISVGKKPGDSFMYYKDPDYVKMSYLGISTGFGSNGVWNFDFNMFNCDDCIKNHIPHSHTFDL